MRFVPRKYYWHFVANILMIVSFIVSYWYLSTHKYVVPDLSDHRKIIRGETINMYRDEDVGFSLSLPENTYIAELHPESVLIRRGNVRHTDYQLLISTETYDPRIAPAHYLAAYQEQLASQGPPNSELVFSQMFDQKTLSGVQMVFVRGEPHRDAEEHFVFAQGGRSVFLKFNYSLDHRDILEPEMVWIRSTLSFDY